MWLFDRLTIRIFTIFSLTIVFFLMLIIVLPSLDSRNLTYLANKDKEIGNLLANQIEKDLIKIPKDSFRWWMRFIVVMDSHQKPGQSLFVVTPNEQIITAETKNIDLIKNFSEKSHNVADPARKIYDSQEIIGPFLLHYSNAEYQLYILQQATDTQSQFVNFIFDHPFLLLALTMLASSPFLLWLSWSIAKPARRLKQAADQVAKGNLQEMPELEQIGSSEYKATGASFNHMLRELKRMQDVQQRLFSDISHELRTPLTRLQLATSLLRRKQGESSEVIRINNEALKLDSMIGDLLSLARQQHDNNEVRESKKTNKLFKQVLDNATFEAEQIGKIFTVINPPTNQTILCYPVALCSALENVIRNAFRYSNKKVTVDFITQQQKITITIDDDGPGVAESELEQIFRPFYRTSEARDRESGGTGLGLAIVANAIIRDHGTVKAEKSHLGGLRVVIILPIYKY
ncbi:MULTISPECIES: envelope stress sensor histidine kinase CpxA [unclassified Gilliamella]|uniref:envelope stress sensor histidine kinase CpxA n=1 Tax=unclassified Gilliamella TaxID=2685620 RepID=UPI001327B1FB|nr:MULTISPECIES: envelope stress sensor histidine kinase CpxA [unclassified Gilliamella]MWN31790.1 envelope stress sensor histidine kinase CpxA [Gilliamella sp. Pra-s60]MWP28897.1 envelope stress sensor histidine kinase CpxA [Gilliamella sp. Pra-s54]